MKFLFSIFLIISTQASESSIDFLGGHNQIVSEEEFLKQRGTEEIDRKKKEYENIKSRCQNSEEFQCSLDLEYAKYRLEKSYEKLAHSEVLLREELNKRLNQCLNDNKQDALHPCLKAEFKWWTERVKCGQSNNYKTSEYKSCVAKTDKALTKTYQENKTCNNESYIIKENIGLGSLSNLFIFYKDPKNWPKEPQNTYLRKNMKCMMSAYYEQKSFRFNPKVSSFLTGSSKTKYLSLISSNNINSNNEKKLIRFTPSVNRSNFLRFSNTFSYERPNYLIFSETLTGNEKFLVEMIKTTNYSRTLKEEEAAKKYLGRRIPISHPDNSTKIAQKDGPFMKYESHLGINAEFISGHASSLPRFDGEFVSSIPEFNSEGKVLWKDKEKGLLSWAKIGNKLSNKLLPFVKLRDSNVSVTISSLIGSESLIFSVSKNVQRFNKPLAEFKVSKKKVSGEIFYTFESDYQGYLTKKYLHDIKRKKQKIKENQIQLSYYSSDHPQYKSLMKQIDEAKMILKQVSGDQSEDASISESKTSLTETKEPALPIEQKQIEIETRTNAHSKEGSEKKKEKSSVSVTIDGYKSLINGCYSDGIGGTLVDIHDKRRDSFLNMVSELESINCSNIEGKGCHSEKARELIIKHYYIEKKSHKEALAWKDNTDNPNADKCLKVYGFMK